MALERAAEASASRLIEPAAAFETAAHAGLVRAVSGPDAFPQSAINVDGRDNIFVTGFGVTATNFRNFEIRGERNVVYFGPNARVASSEVVITGSNNLVYFGAFSSSGGVSIAICGSGQTVVVSDHCMISSRVSIGRTFDLALYSTETGRRIDAPKDVMIGERTWIAREVVIEPGVVVGPNSVIGQCAVLSERYPEGAVLAGAPARVRRMGVTWGRQEDQTIDAMLRSSHYKQHYLRPQEALRQRIESYGGGGSQPSAETPVERTG